MNINASADVFYADADASDSDYEPPCTCGGIAIGGMMGFFAGRFLGRYMHTDRDIQVVQRFYISMLFVEHYINYNLIPPHLTMPRP